MTVTASSVVRNSEHKPQSSSPQCQVGLIRAPNIQLIGAEVGFQSNLWTGVISVAENEGTVNPILNELRFTSKANIYLQGWQ